jgi:hypothetical protein
VTGTDRVVASEPHIQEFGNGTVNGFFRPAEKGELLFWLHYFIYHHLNELVSY